MKNAIFSFTFAILLLTTSAFAQLKGVFTDARDGKVYKTITIGTQTWMAENLAYLPSVSHSFTSSFDFPVYYVYGYDGNSVSAAKASANYITYGVLYNWEAAKIACPSGWHLPTDAEWTILENYLGTTAGDKLKETGDIALVEPQHWCQ